MTTLGRHRFGWIEPHAARFVYCGEIYVGQTVTPTKAWWCWNCQRLGEFPVVDSASRSRAVGSSVGS